MGIESFLNRVFLDRAKARVLYYNKILYIRFFLLFEICLTGWQCIIYMHKKFALLKLKQIFLLMIVSFFLMHIHFIIFIVARKAL
ncbi:hypothetical protein SAMN05444380_106101 [Thermophagus xiamenensis]|uniref:Uncharacterized protein n=1 Tax=Thermophagus xiamenensis TaxID=385682 RepID=A0A1I1XSI2_9BACT|nr:hypothetical protein SAMN05444380_106101 [Thermophagus xiamenensis]